LWLASLIATNIQEDEVSKVLSRKGIKVIAVAAILVASSVSFGTVSAQAANKANGTCTTPGAVTKIGGKTFTCKVSPLANAGTTKTVWISAGCTTAGKSYKSALAQTAQLQTLAAAQVAALQGDITKFQTSATNIQAKITMYTDKVAAYIAKNPSQANAPSILTIQHAVQAMQTSLGTTTANITRY
jgi:hypothetical protein